jgi:hypothetical protein
MSESSGLALADRSTRRRWLISAAIVVLFHAGLAAGVLTWRNMRAAPPVEIDLTPLPSAPGQNEAQAAAAAEQTSPAPNQTNTASAAAGNQAAPSDSRPQPAPLNIAPPAERSALENAAEAGQSAGPIEAAPGKTVTQLPSSPQDTEASASASGGLAAGSPRPSSPMANMPLDTSVTVPPPVRGNGAIGPLASRETGPLGRMPMSEFRSARPFGVPDIPRNGAQGARGAQGAQGAHGAHGANGAHVQDRARAALARSIGRTETSKNAIGSAATVLASRGDTTGPNAGSTRNAIGITANFRPRIPRAEVGGNKIGVTAIAGRAMPTAPVINGHGFARSAIGPAMIGGPARASGGLSGTDFHLRHP